MTLYVICASVGGNWKVSVMTSDSPDAGTSSQVYIVLYGECRSSVPIYLYRRDGARFQAGHKDIFTVSHKMEQKLLMK